MRGQRCALFIVILVSAQATEILQAHAQHSARDHGASSVATAVPEFQGITSGGGWEGSAQGIAYSKFNHRVAGLFLLIIGLSELGHTVRVRSSVWTRLALPGAFGLVGVFLLVWSDHEAWPIGSLSFTQTFFGQDLEILQHKFYGVLAATVAISELLRRIGWSLNPVWEAPLPLFAVIGGLMLFVHSHGIHPAPQKLEFHHAIMGSMAVSAGIAKSVAAGMTGLSSRSVRRWELVWAGFILLIGVQLLVYSE